MCGIAGTFLFDRRADVDRVALQQATRVIAHRGPDDEGLWTRNGVGLGARRLAVIDLSERGHQPMSNEDGSVWIAFNGEIYNFQELRRQLVSQGHRFRSDTDTETIVHLYEQEGIEAIGRLRGMFAIALWDARRDEFFLIRDRLGKKPLFYHEGADRLVFGSEIKCILQAGFEADVDTEALHHYLTFGYVPAPWSAFRGVRKLPPGHYLHVTEDRRSVRQYWQPLHAPQRGDSEDTLLEQFSALLEEATRLRMIADVPIGVLLSGGLDSSAIVAMMRRVTSGPIRTFSVGFEEREYDELSYARKVAEKFETEHHELVVRPDAAALVPRLTWHYNEPFADSSAIPSFAVCELARKSVTVALNGDGGDETWLGYDRYVAAATTKYQQRIPLGVRQGLARAAQYLPVSHAKSGVYRVRRFASGLAESPLEQYTRWITIFDEPAKRDLYAAEFSSTIRSASILEAAAARSDATTFPEAVAHADLQTYLPDDLLVKMDIASMAYSLELRSPLLDHRVVEFALSVPLRMKLRRTTQKYLLRRLMDGVLPPEVLGRRKMGFGVPIDRWFRHDLREMAYDLLLDTRATSRGYFRPQVVRRYLDEHSRGVAHHHPRLWALLMLEMWHRTFIDQRCASRPPTHEEGQRIFR